MRIAVLSDIHDHLHHLRAFEPVLREVDAAVFCGDFCAPFSLKALAQAVSGPVHVVFGNNDGDQWLLSQIAAGFENVHLEGFFARLEMGRRRIFVVHYPEIAQDVAASARYDLVCCGHSHKILIERRNETLLLNPGEVMGRFGTSTLALYDTEAHEATIYALRDGKPTPLGGEA